MNTRSLKFQLIAWYAVLLTGCFVLLGAATALVLKGSLVRALTETQLRRARQIAQLVTEEIRHKDAFRVGEEVEVRYAPSLNDRFVRITQKDGSTLYLSSSPKSQSFDPATLPPPLWPQGAEDSHQASILGGRKMLLAAHTLQLPGGASFLIETGAPMDEVQADLKKWMLFLLVMLPLMLGVAVGGGFILVKRALLPVDQITGSAERISSQNLSKRLPVAQTGDELERLSTALNHMIERLDAAFEHSRRFVADASHELRTPITVLRGELENLVQDERLPRDLTERLGSALEEVERLANIVEGLFAISRLDAGEAAAEWVRFDLAELAAATADQMGLLAEDKNITLTSSGSFGVWIEGDRSRMKQVIVNLLDNAIKYTRAGGTINLDVLTQNNKAILKVSDNGIGITPEALPRIFERFYRVDPSRSRDQGGAGLGLSIVRSICTAHHGRVDATSTPGQGSVFTVELPLAPGAGAVSIPKVKNHEQRISAIA